MSYTEKNLQTLARGVDKARAPRRNEGKLLSKINELQEQLTRVKQDFEIEKNYKNEAYYFIMGSGNFQKFAEYHEKFRANIDYHGACLAQLYLNSLTTK